MKAPSPAFSFYPKDWLADDRVAAMTNEARGVYITLLCHCWVSGGIPNPAEVTGKTALQRMAGVRDQDWPALWAQVGPCFTTDPDSNRLLQLRLEDERAKQRQRSKDQSERALRGWAKRRGGTDAGA